jgi:hypothetical protein
MFHSLEPITTAQVHDQICVVCATAFAISRCLIDNSVSISFWNLLHSSEKQEAIARHAADVKSANIDVYGIQKEFIRDLALPVQVPLLHTNGGYLVAPSQDGRSLRHIVRPVAQSKKEDYLLCSSCYSSPHPTPTSPLQSYAASPPPKATSGIDHIHQFLSETPDANTLQWAFHLIADRIGLLRNKKTPSKSTEQTPPPPILEEEDADAIFG